ncbi:hypothetical protein INR49_003050, partial [Caranx melampygus]
SSGDGKGGYWWSPQRYQEVGSTWRDTRRRRVIFPGNTGFSDVPSSLDAGYCHLHPTLVAVSLAKTEGEGAPITFLPFESERSTLTLDTWYMGYG